MTDEPLEDGDSWEEESPPATPTDQMVRRANLARG